MLPGDSGSGPNHSNRRLRGHVAVFSPFCVSLPVDTGHTGSEVTLLSVPS